MVSDQVGLIGTVGLSVGDQAVLISGIKDWQFG